jgi:two-component system response regulator
MPEVRSLAPSTAPVIAPLIPEQAPWFRVFHINDSTDDQVLFQAACRRGNVPFNWHVADSAEKGISYLQTLMEHARKVPVCWPDLILLDVVMPIRNGFEVLKFIRAAPELKHLPVVIFSAALYPDCEKESMRLGANLFLLKPLDFKEEVELAKNLYRMLLDVKGEGGGSAPSKGT